MASTVLVLAGGYRGITVQDEFYYHFNESKTLGHELLFNLLSFFFETARMT